MTTGAPVSAALLIPANEGAPVIPWAEARSYLTEASTANPRARKGRNLAGDPRCSLAVHGDGLDLVVEGTTAKVTDEATLHRVADAYGSKCEWPVSVRDGAFWADGAPTAGPPPTRSTG